MNPWREYVYTSPRLDATGQVADLLHGRARQFVEPLGDGLSLLLLALPGGDLVMGSAHGSGYEDEELAHRVRLAPFLLGQYPVTQAQWQALMGAHVTRFHGADLPVDSVSWQAAQRLCARLAKRTGRPYRLPSEAEWECACRAGTSTPFSNGPTLTSDVANYSGLFVYASEPVGVYRHHTLPVGSLPANPWGLHDMHGNLWEWCADAWHASYAGAPGDGRARCGRTDEPYRVARGGCWHDVPAVCRSAARLRYRASEGDELVGFRVALELGSARA